MQCAVGLSVSPAIEPMALDVAARGRYWAGTTKHREPRFTPQAIGILAGGDKNLTGRFDPHPWQLGYRQSEPLDQWNYVAIEIGDLIVQIQNAAWQ